MISDVLFEALDGIRAYQDRDDTYASLAQPIDVVCEVMDTLRLYLDTPPVPFLREPLDSLQAAIGSLDLSVLRAARQRLLEDVRKGARSTDPRPSQNGPGGELAPTEEA